jgi:hypothetical protein
MFKFIFCLFLFLPLYAISQQSNIIGKPYKIGELEIAQNSFKESYNWFDAKKACENLGPGWRLPSFYELNFLFLNLYKFRFIGANYWSSTDHLDKNYALIHVLFESISNDEYLSSDFPKNMTFSGPNTHAVRGKEIKNKAFINIDYTKYHKVYLGNVIRIDNLEIAEFNHPNQIQWDSAISISNNLGNGWRLPSLDELNLIFSSKLKLHDFDDMPYWSINKYLYDTSNLIWTFNINSGHKEYFNKRTHLNVRFVRNVEESKKSNLLGNPNNIIGTPIKISNFEIAQFDFPITMDFESAIIACSNLGSGWRLPTEQEVKLIYKNRNIIGNFSKGGYFTAGKYSNYDILKLQKNTGLNLTYLKDSFLFREDLICPILLIDNGDLVIKSIHPGSKFRSFGVRAVRTL